MDYSNFFVRFYLQIFILFYSATKGNSYVYCDPFSRTKIISCVGSFLNYADIHGPNSNVLYGKPLLCWRFDSYKRCSKNIPLMCRTAAVGHLENLYSLICDSKYKESSCKFGFSVDLTHSPMHPLCDGLECYINDGSFVTMLPSSCPMERFIIKTKSIPHGQILKLNRMATFKCNDGVISAKGLAKLKTSEIISVDCLYKEVMVNSGNGNSYLATTTQPAFVIGTGDEENDEPFVQKSNNKLATAAATNTTPKTAATKPGSFATTESADPIIKTPSQSGCNFSGQTVFCALMAGSNAHNFWDPSQQVSNTKYLGPVAEIGEAVECGFSIAHGITGDIDPITSTFELKIGIGIAGQAPQLTVLFSGFKGPPIKNISLISSTNSLFPDVVSADSTPTSFAIVIPPMVLTAGVHSIKYQLQCENKAVQSLLEPSIMNSLDTKPSSLNELLKVGLTDSRSIEFASRPTMKPKIPGFTSTTAETSAPLTEKSSTTPAFSSALTTTFEATVQSTTLQSITMQSKTLQSTTMQSTTTDLFGKMEYATTATMEPTELPSAQTEAANKSLLRILSTNSTSKAMYVTTHTTDSLNTAVGSIPVTPVTVKEAAKGILHVATSIDNAVNTSKVLSIYPKPTAIYAASLTSAAASETSSTLTSETTDSLSVAKMTTVSLLTTLLDTETTAATTTKASIPSSTGTTRLGKSSRAKIAAANDATTMFAVPTVKPTAATTVAQHSTASSTMVNPEITTSVSTLEADIFTTEQSAVTKKASKPTINNGTARERTIYSVEPPTSNNTVTPLESETKSTLNSETTASSSVAKIDAVSPLATLLDSETTAVTTTISTFSEIPGATGTTRLGKSLDTKNAAAAAVLTFKPSAATTVAQHSTASSTIVHPEITISQSKAAVFSTAQSATTTTTKTNTGRSKTIYPVEPSTSNTTVTAALIATPTTTIATFAYTVAPTKTSKTIESIAGSTKSEKTYGKSTKRPAVTVPKTSSSTTADSAETGSPSIDTTNHTTGSTTKTPADFCMLEVDPGDVKAMNFYGPINCSQAESTGFCTVKKEDSITFDATGCTNSYSPVTDWYFSIFSPNIDKLALNGLRIGCTDAIVSRNYPQITLFCTDGQLNTPAVNAEIFDSGFNVFGIGPIKDVTRVECLREEDNCVPDFSSVIPLYKHRK